MTHRAEQAGRVGVGVIGCGDIAGRYLTCLAAMPDIDLIGCASRTGASARARARQFGIAAMEVEDLVRDQRVDLVVNLTTPLDHHGVSLAALMAGKHLYTEKPLAASVAQARELQQLASARDVVLSCAPATILGPAQQAARSLLDDGGLGRPLGAIGAMVYPGPEHFHHNPQHLYDVGAGPLFDMGIYHVAALVNLLGPIAQVSAAGGQARSHRTVLSGPRAGDLFAVSVPTHVSALLCFASGASATLTLSFDGVGTRVPGLEVQAGGGTLCLPQPGQFCGPVMLSRRFGVWDMVPTDDAGWEDRYWAVGIADTVEAILTGSAPRLSATFALHCLDVLASITRSIATGRSARLTTDCERPAPLGLREPFLDRCGHPAPPVLRQPVERRAT